MDMSAHGASATCLDARFEQLRYNTYHLIPVISRLQHQNCLKIVF